MKDGDFFSKIKRLLLNVTKLHRHVFENPGCKIKYSVWRFCYGKEKWKSTKSNNAGNNILCRGGHKE